ncbi:MAG: CHAP domain-containing protein [Clostridia bacterium]|nr:CHAP domain-containing protein [Clostridia bacterium]
MNLRKICAGLLAAAIASASLCMAASAVEPSYKVSSDYKDTLYYDNLLAFELTGDGATDVVAVALSQLGYHEGNNTGDLDGGNAGGNRNFVEYNVLFGKLDNGEGNGYSYGYAWCAAFVNWCLRQARVDQELTGGMYVSCHAWRSWFVTEGKQYGASYHARTDDYIPKKGDLIFYKSLSATHSRTSDHIGIVIGCEDGMVYAIEGNGDNRVALHEYSLGDRYIVGYGSIAYKTANIPAVDHDRTEDHLPGFMIAGKGALKAYAAPDLNSGTVASMTAGAVYRILEVQGKYGRVETEDGKRGWVPLTRFTPMTTDAYYTVRIVNGAQVYEIRVAAGQSCTIPSTDFLAEKIGELTYLTGWRTDTGAVMGAGEVLTPTADTVLMAVIERPTEAATEQETESDASSAEAGTTHAPESDSMTSDAGTLPQATTDAMTQAGSTVPAQTGCGGVIGAASVLTLLTAGIALVFGKKKK